MNTIIKERVFDKEKSVFRDWREDTPDDLVECMRHDFKHWKLEKFVKDPDDQRDIKNVVESFS